VKVRFRLESLKQQQNGTIESSLLNLNGAKSTGAGVADRLGLRFANVSMR